jgi:hypothetical protein
MGGIEHTLMALTVFGSRRSSFCAERGSCAGIQTGACRSAAFSVLVVLLIVHSPGVVGFDQNQYTLDVLCRCRNEVARLNVYAKGYCNNACFEMKSRYSEDFQCGQCKVGKYHKVKVVENRVVVSQYQELKTRGVKVRCEFTWTTRREWVEYNPSREKRDLMRLACIKDLEWYNEPFDGTERAYQSCQHCPIFTIVNLVKMVESHIWNREFEPEGGLSSNTWHPWNKIMVNSFTETRSQGQWKRVRSCTSCGKGISKAVTERMSDQCRHEVRSERARAVCEAGRLKWD